MDKRLWNVILASYGEIVTKSDPVRRLMTRKLLRNIRSALRSGGITGKVKHEKTRIIVEVKDLNGTLNVLRRIFGIEALCSARRLKFGELEAFIATHVGELLGNVKTFAVRVRRVGEHPFTSLDIAKRIGSIITSKTNLKVDLKSPDITLNIEIRDDICYIYTYRIRGFGGLPLGVSGRVVALISTGIDSPVAAWMIMKRGSPIIAVHALLYNSDAEIEKFRAILYKLRKWHYGEPLKAYTYNHSLALKIIKEYAGRYTCIVCKRLMYRVAEEIAKTHNAKAIVTGESLAQVASQTIDNISVQSKAVELPILRPLIGLNKLEIEQIAKQIGIYEVSTSPPQITCWATPKKPATTSTIKDITDIEEEIDINSLVGRVMKSLRKVEL